MYVGMRPILHPKVRGPRAASVSTPDAARAARIKKTVMDPFAPAHEMLRALRESRTSARELVELHLERIERFNPALNAIVVPADDPRAAAERADASRRLGNEAPLLGLPVTLKV